jgi:hypothetical protein
MGGLGNLVPWVHRTEAHCVIANNAIDAVSLTTGTQRYTPAALTVYLSHARIVPGDVCHICFIWPDRTPCSQMLTHGEFADGPQAATCAKASHTLSYEGFCAIIKCRLHKPRDQADDSKTGDTPSSETSKVDGADTMIGYGNTC